MLGTLSASYRILSQAQPYNCRTHPKMLQHHCVITLHRSDRPQSHTGHDSPATPENREVGVGHVIVRLRQLLRDKVGAGATRKESVIPASIPECLPSNCRVRDIERSALDQMAE